MYTCYTHNLSFLSILHSSQTKRRARESRAQIEFLARSTRNSYVVLRVICVVKFRCRARFTRTHTDRLSTAVKFREKTKAHPDERKKPSGKKKTRKWRQQRMLQLFLVLSSLFSITLHVPEWEQQPCARKFELDHHNDRRERERERERGRDRRELRPYRVRIGPFVVFFVDYMRWTISWFAICAARLD